MIIATAGHVDHGKTTLVHALTGVDTDRLAEEKRRGMTIDLGFAYMPLRGGATIGFVDVPGHRKFLHTMVAGVAAVDFGLLVIAADDGPMPQTLEHLSILDLLGIRRGACVISKCDAVTPDRVNAVTNATRQLLAGTVLDGAPIFSVAAANGEGIHTLKDHLTAAADKTGRRFRDGPFRFVIDRAFNIVGSGTVVTGTAISGDVTTGDRLVLSPSGHPVRVRKVRTQDEELSRGQAGQRLGINIAGTGINLDAVSRGQLLVAPERFFTSKRIDVSLTLTPSEKPIGVRNLNVHLHIGAADIEATLKVVDPLSVPSGGRALAHLILKRPVSSVCGERFILRDRSASRTIGGGRVIDPLAPTRRIGAPERLTRMRAANTEDPLTALRGLLAIDAASVGRQDFMNAWNLEDTGTDTLEGAADAISLGAGKDRVWISTGQRAALRQRALSAIEHWHSAHPSKPGIDMNQLRRQIATHLPIDAFRDFLSQSEQLRIFGGNVALASFNSSLPPEAENIWRQAQPMIENAGNKAPRVAELADAMSLTIDQVSGALEAVARGGLIHRVARNRYYLPGDLHRLAKKSRDCVAADNDGILTIRAFRDATSLGRNLTIEVLEYFDDCGFTMRRGDRRTIIGNEDAIFAEPLDNA
jgi:selenocysteine-specific elongation factor